MPHHFWRLYEYLFIAGVKILSVIKGSHRSPPHPLTKENVDYGALDGYHISST
jgi:hypothetical protein